MEYIEIYVRMHWENLGDILGCKIFWDVMVYIVGNHGT